jgi:acetyltransferase-like isoleucine patch superfamily enzyme
LLKNFAQRIQSKVNYMTLARKHGVKMLGWVEIERNVDVSLGRDATLVLGKNVHIGKDTVITLFDKGALVIGNNVFIAHGVTIAANLRIDIGLGTLIGEYVSVRDHDHNYKSTQGNLLWEKGWVSTPVVIENNCWIGCKSTITRGVHIGHNAAVGANSVVTRDVLPNALVVGSPAASVNSKPTFHH